jgi:hypothetical protein
MRNRWLIYAGLGLCFGLADWYFLDLLASLSQGQAFTEDLSEFARYMIVIPLVALNYGVWLIPVIPAALYEMKHSQSVRRAALSAALVWSMALISYYAYYTFLLMFVGLPHLEFMLFSNRHSAGYWADWWPPFRRVILNQFLDWLGVAIIGGGVIGSGSVIVFNSLRKNRALRLI